MTKSLLLASASPARKTTLLNAGITPMIAVANLDEDALLDDYLASHPDQELRRRALAQVKLLAQAKTRAVAESLEAGGAPVLTATGEAVEAYIPDVIVGCDSMLEIGNEIVGKPHTPEVARERLRAMSGTVGYLHSGHCVIDVAAGREVSAVSTAAVHIAELTDLEIERYVATGEPLVVAGSFTVDGFGGPFIDRIEGDYHGIVGISLPLLRQLLAKLNYSITDFWDY